MSYRRSRSSKTSASGRRSSRSRKPKDLKLAVNQNGRTAVIGTKGVASSVGPDLGAQAVELHTEAGVARPALQGQWFNDGFAGTMGELLSAIEDDREPIKLARDNLPLDPPLPRGAPLGAQRHRGEGLSRALIRPPGSSPGDAPPPPREREMGIPLAREATRSGRGSRARPAPG